MLFSLLIDMSNKLNNNNHHNGNDMENLFYRRNADSSTNDAQGVAE